MPNALDPFTLRLSKGGSPQPIALSLSKGYPDFDKLSPNG